MEPPVSPVLFSAVLFVGMLILLEAGRSLGVRQRLKESSEERSNLSAIEGAVFALFGLLIAFIFGGAALRFNEKRMLVAEEANAIGTAYLRLNLVANEAQPRLKESFRRYVDSRLETYRKMPDMAAVEMAMARSRVLQETIWSEAVPATTLTGSHPDAGKLLLPALNNMIDITTTRTTALQTHPPRIVYALLFVLGLISSLLAGYRMASSQHRNWLHILSFAIITVVVAYVILDVEYPRAGLIRLVSADQILVELRQSMR